uniref:Metastasis associated 1 family, member 3 n=1 Tax=Oncorhynchus kisutch TaxID=8019 RepID=A0A8C7HUI5_ONCKI
WPANCRVTDYVFIENSSSNPYLIRRIEELNKTASGNVEAKVVCFYRRRDISHSLIQLADKHAQDLEEEKESPSEADLTDKQEHQLRHRELFLSRQYESLPATHIRGKCSVALLNETEAVLSYLDKEDMFFYSLVYDPTQKTLLADKGEIRVGPRFQADVPDMLQEGDSDERDQSKLEEKLWDPDCPLSSKQIDQFLVVARAVGTFARALDCSSSVRQPSLHASAAAASRDITLFHAMDTLHRHGYDLSSALSVLVPSGGPVLCRDEMEEWSASEAAMFEEALEKYGKDFNDIRQDFLPWKSLTSIIEYYYMWKTTDRYVQQKRLKAAEAESKLKQVYIPTYNKPNPNQISVTNGKMATVNGAGPGAYHAAGGGRACESCYSTQSAQWYSWGPPNMQCRLCVSCWMYWKKYGGLKMPSRPRSRGHGPRQSSHMVPVRNSGSPKSSTKTKQAFLLQATRLTKLARHMCRDIIRLRRAARRPFVPINCGAIKAPTPTHAPIPSCKPLSHAHIRMFLCSSHMDSLLLLSIAPTSYLSLSLALHLSHSLSLSLSSSLHSSHLSPSRSLPLSIPLCVNVTVVTVIKSQLKPSSLSPCASFVCVPVITPPHSPIGQRTRQGPPLLQHGLHPSLPTSITPQSHPHRVHVVRVTLIYLVCELCCYIYP